MARTTINPTQLTMTGSNAGSISEGSLAATHVFLAQAASGEDVKTITADAMQKYFSKIDLGAATDTSHRIILGAVNGGSGGAGVDDVDLMYDGGLLYDPTGDGTLTLTGDLAVGDDISLTSDDAVLKFGAGNDVTFTHDGGSGSGMDVASAGDFDISSVGNTTITSTANEAGSILLRENAGTSGTIKIHADQGTAATEGAASVQLLSDVGGVGIKSGLNAAGALRFTADGGTSETIIIHADQSTVDGAASAGAIQLIADAGGISLNAAADKDVYVAGGQVNVVGSHNAANSIYLRANAGTSETIKIHADQGTSVTEGAASVQLLSDAGGIGIKSTANLADAILITADGGTSETIKIHSDQGTAAGSIALLSDAGGVSIDGGSTSHGVKIGTATSGAPVTLGHSTSEVTVADNLNVNGDTVVAGNLTVNGTTTTVNSTTVTVDDTLIVLGKDNAGTSADLGIIFEQSGSLSNLGFFYDADQSKFVMQQNLSEDGTTTGSITLNNYAPLQVAAFNATSGDFSGDMTAATITMTGFTVDADGDTALKSLAVDDGSTIGCDSDTDLLTLNDGALTAKGTVTVGVDDTGHDVRFYGATSGKSLLWDESEDSLVITGDATDALRVAGGVDIDGVINVGLDDTGYDVKFFGDTASAYMLWDASADDLILGGAAGLIVPDGQLTLGSTAVTSTAAELNHLDGIADASYDQTADSVVFFDATDSKLKYEGANHFATAIAGDGLQASSGQLKQKTPSEEFFQSGSGTVFTLALDPTAMIDNTLAVYLNGMLQLLSGSLTGNTGDYSVSGSAIVMVDALDDDDVLIVRYVAK